MNADCTSTAKPDAIAPAAHAELDVLIVDDEEAIVRQLADGLRLFGYRVVTAHSAAEARALAQREARIAVMVSDVRMPGCDGLSLAHDVLSMRSEENAIEVVLITGHATVDDATAAVRARVSDFLRKPFRLADAAKAVEVAMTHATERRRHASETERNRRSLTSLEAELSGLQARLLEALGRLAPLQDGNLHAKPRMPDLRAMSHALRTPLNAIAGGTELLHAKAQTCSARAAYLALLRQGVRDAVEAVELVEEWHRLGEHEGEPTQVDAALQLRAVTTIVAGSASPVTLGIAKAEAASIVVDRHLLRRALELMLGAAVELARPAGVVKGRAQSVTHAGQFWWTFTCTAQPDTQTAEPVLPPEPTLTPAGTVLSRTQETLRFAVARRAAELLGARLTSWSDAAGAIAFRFALPHSRTAP